MNIEPAGIVENQFQEYEQQIQKLNAEIENLFYDEFRLSLLERVSGKSENMNRWAEIKLQLHSLFEKRKSTRLKQRALRNHSVDEPEVQVFIQSLLNLYEGMAASYKDDEKTPK